MFVFVTVMSLTAILADPSHPSRAGASPSNNTTLSAFDHVALDDNLTDQHARVFRLYWAFFGREPDAEGALYWVGQVDQCVALQTISDSFADSEEFRSLYGPLDSTQFVDLIYRNVLERPGDQEGVTYWVGLIDRGLLTKGSVVLNISLSSELTGRAPYPSDGIPDRQCHRPDGTPTGRAVDVTRYEPLLSVSGLTLYTPSSLIEHAGFHQSSHPGALDMNAVDPAPVRMSTMGTRNRGTGATTAIDIVTEPSTEITAPVSGRVARAGEYSLYCRYPDGYVVINPEDRPDLEVKILHMQNVKVAPGQTVAVGDPIGNHATPFPFRSQIDDLTVEESWPHVHIEVVDPSVPRKPSSGSGC